MKFRSKDEREFWEQVYAAAVTSYYKDVVAPSIRADRALVALRERNNEQH